MEKNEWKDTIISLSEEEKARRKEIRERADWVLREFRFYTDIRMNDALDMINHEHLFEKKLGKMAFRFFTKSNKSREEKAMFLFEANHAALSMPLDTDEIQDAIYRWAELHHIERDLESAIEYYKIFGPDELEEITEKALAILEGRTKLKDTYIFNGVEVPARKKPYIPEDD